MKIQPADSLLSEEQAATKDYFERQSQKGSHDMGSRSHEVGVRHAGEQSADLGLKSLSFETSRLEGQTREAGHLGNFGNLLNVLKEPLAKSDRHKFDYAREMSTAPQKQIVTETQQIEVIVPTKKAVQEYETREIVVPERRTIIEHERRIIEVPIERVVEVQVKKTIEVPVIREVVVQEKKMVEVSVQREVVNPGNHPINLPLETRILESRQQIVYSQDLPGCKEVFRRELEPKLISATIIDPQPCGEPATVLETQTQTVTVTTTKPATSFGPSSVRSEGFQSRYETPSGLEQSIPEKGASVMAERESRSSF
jgi:hypothetical protein